MIKNNKANYIIRHKNLYGCTKSKFLPTRGFKWIDPKEFDSNKYSNNSSKRCVLKVDLEYCKQLWKLHNNQPQALDKIKTKRKMLPNYQIKIADFQNISIGNV